MTLGPLLTFRSIGAARTDMDVAIDLISALESAAGMHVEWRSLLYFFGSLKRTEDLQVGVLCGTGLDD